jgi:UPF0148 protein
LKESDTANEGTGIQKAVELIRKGATMLNEACPECSGPLFQLPAPNNDIICPQCDKKVVIVSDDSEIFEIEKEAILSELDKVISGQIENLNRKLEKEDDIDELNQLGRLILLYLEALEKLKRIRS